MSFGIWNSKEGSKLKIDEELDSQVSIEETEHILDREEEIDELSLN